MAGQNRIGHDRTSLPELARACQSLPKDCHKLVRACQKTAEGLPKLARRLRRASPILAEMARMILSGGKSVHDWSEWF